MQKKNIFFLFPLYKMASIQFTNKITGKNASLDSIKRYLRDPKRKLEYTEENVRRFYNFNENIHLEQQNLRQHQIASQRPHQPIQQPQYNNKIYNPDTGRFIENNKRNRDRIALKQSQALFNIQEIAPIRNPRRDERTIDLDLGVDQAIKKLKHLFRSFTNHEAIKVTIRSLDFEGKQQSFIYNDKRQFIDNVYRLFTYEEGYQSHSLQSQELKDYYYKNFRVEKIERISGGCNRNKNETKKFNAYKYEIIVSSPITKNNQCGYKSVVEALNCEVSCHNMYKELNFEAGSKLSPKQVEKMYNKYKKDNDKELKLILDYKIIDLELTEEFNYIIYDKEHYSFVKEFQEINEEIEDDDTKHRKRTGVYDFETRPIECDIKLGEITTKKLKPSILKVGLDILGQSLKSTFRMMTFETDPEKDCARKFIDFLNTEKNKYNFYAHNGSNFDIFFILNVMTEDEYKTVQIFRKGLSFTSVKYLGNTFLDSRDHLTDSLDKLCKDFKTENAKLENITIGDITIDTKQLCFYKPELNFNEFMNLKNTEPDYWNAYLYYCEMDVKSLYEILKKYKEACVNIVKDLARFTDEDGNEFYNTYIVKYGNIHDKLTIGSGALNLFKLLNKNTYHYKKVLQFYDDNTQYKIEFTKKCSPGGISHCHRPQITYEQCHDLDKTSQYPCAMINCKIASGKSKLYNANNLPEKYNVYNYYGYYHLKNVKFSSKCPDLKIIPKKDPVTKSYRWSSNEIFDELYIDSQMLVYQLYKGYIESYQIEEALLSDHYTDGELLCGKIIKTLFNKKSEQDVYKNTNDVRYNPALRQVYKFLMNSLYGKCLEDPSKYTSIMNDNSEELKNYILKKLNLKQISNPEEIKLYNNEKSLLKSTIINGNKVFLKPEEDNYNKLCGIGSSVLSYSKIMLNEYLECCPNKHDDIMMIETDGFMIKDSVFDKFVDNVNNWKFITTNNNNSEYLKMFNNIDINMGKKLGNLEEKAKTLKDSATCIVMKKTYCYTDEKKNFVAKGKGFPTSTINDDGSKKVLVTEDTFKKLLNKENIKITFKALKKSYTDNFAVLAYDMTRNIKFVKS